MVIYIQLIRQNIQMSRDNVRMSKIMEHNIYNHTDELYNPLRNALKKSGIPFHYNSQRSSLTPDKLAASVLTHDLRMLSPVEAENIRKTTFITSDRELVPTHQMEKVMGKHFYAVDIEQKVGEPITPDQLKLRPIHKFEEIVYDFKDSHQPSWLPSPSNNFSDLHKLKSVHTAASTRYYPKPQLVNLTGSDAGMNPNETYTIHEDSNSGSRVSNLLLNSGIKPYQFKDKMKSSRSSSRIQFRGRDDDYKYNLFSLIDEPLNTGCRGGCFSSNQICAPRRAASKWK